MNPHVDNSQGWNRRKYRRLNLLFYVTPDLKEKDGGNLELWDIEVVKPLKNFMRKFIRLVVMETTPFSYHSVDRINKNRFKGAASVIITFLTYHQLVKIITT